MNILRISFVVFKDLLNEIDSSKAVLSSTGVVLGSHNALMVLSRLRLLYTLCTVFPKDDLFSEEQWDP